MKHSRLGLALIIMASVLGMGVAPRAMADGPTEAVFRVCLTDVLEEEMNTTITFEVTNTSKRAVSYIAISTGGLTRLGPASNTTYLGQAGTYKVAWTGLSGNPGFESIKFTSSSSDQSFRQGATESFSITVENYHNDYQFSVQAHAGARWETFSSLSENDPCRGAGT